MIINTETNRDNSTGEIIEGIKTVEALKRIRVVLIQRLKQHGVSNHIHPIKSMEAKQYDISTASLLSCVLGLYKELNKLEGNSEN